MTTLPGADVRAYYAALGVPLPAWAQTEAPVRCFADPDAHAHQDHDPSCSVNVQSGAFNCHACGAHGGAYDAALARGRSPRQAIDLMVTHGLTERRAHHDLPSGLVARTSGETAGAVGGRGPRPPANTRLAASPPAGRSDRRPALSLTGEDVRGWARALREDVELLVRLRRERGWKPDTLARWGIGFDGHRVTVPITDQDGRLQGLLRLRVNGWQQPKVIAAAGTRLGLIPHPALAAGSIVLVEGPGDMLAARSVGLPAIAVPGTHAWRAEWAPALTGRKVTAVMDCDRAGREAATRIARDLQTHAVKMAIVDLDPGRDDGYDLTDWLSAGNQPAQLLAAQALTPVDQPRLRASGAAALPASSGPTSPPAAVTARGIGAGRSARCATF